MSSDATKASKTVFKKVGENLYRLESTGTYYALLKRSGKQIRRSLKTTDRALANRRLDEHRKKVNRLTTGRESRKLTFDELSRRWFGTVKVGLKESSAKRIEVCLNGLRPSFAGVMVRNLSGIHCENWLRDRGAVLSAQSYKHERRTLIAVLDYAVRIGLILDNPARDAIPTRKVPKAKITIPTRDQFRTLVATMRKADSRAHHGANLVELLACSGMRLGEAVELTWFDIDWKRGTFTVTGGERGTKNNEPRVVPLFPAMRELLDRIRTESRGGGVSSEKDRIVPLTGPNGASTAIRTACKKAKLPAFLHHSMRHYFCSNAIEAGVDFKVIAGWLGHKDGGILVAKTYGHLRDEHSFDMAKRMTFSAQDDATNAGGT